MSGGADADEPDGNGGSGKGGRGRGCRGGARANDCRVGSGATMAADKLPEEEADGNDDDDDDDDARAVLAFFRLVVVLGAAGADGGVGTRGCCVVAAADSGPALALALAPRFLFASRWRGFFFDGAGAVADAVGGCASSSCRGWEGGAALSERAPMSSVISSGVSADADGGGGDTGAGAGGASWLVAVAVAFGAVVSTRGTSTKSAVSDRGELSGDEEERAAEEDKDQTISSSSSEVESLTHLVLDVCESESMSSDEDREVVMVY